MTPETLESAYQEEAAKHGPGWGAMNWALLRVGSADTRVRAGLYLGFDTTPAYPPFFDDPLMRAAFWSFVCEELGRGNA